AGPPRRFAGDTVADGCAALAQTKTPAEAGVSIFCSRRLQRPGDLFDAEAFDDVALADVFVVLEGHAAFLAHLDFLDLVLEALERLELAFVDDDVVADEADARATLDHALGDTAAGDLADLGDVEHFEDFGIADKGLAPFGLQEAAHGILHVLDEVVNDVVIADFDAVAGRQFLSLLVGTDVEADDDGIA